MTRSDYAVLVGVSTILGIVGLSAFTGYLYRSWLKYRREAFIREYSWPRGLLERFEKHHAGFGRKDSALVSRGLRQFFLAYLRSGTKFVSMPSQIADDLWHEFILYTREYQNFCQRAFGGFLHHTPAVVLSADRRNNEGLRRVWWHCCREENIDPQYPSRLPLLFALDAKYKVAGGFIYHPRCEELRQGNGTSSGAAHCGGDFSSSSIDGSTAGFGDSSGDGSGGDSGGGDSGGGGDGGGGCGGGCGGGGGGD
ncbi:MAG: glycine-rich domain-containing protein [Bradyrhizobium sp.]|nr:hypothetical protein [Bradyrhizobium sp.]